MNKIVIFGIDGASPLLIERWRDELPNLKRIMEGGVYGELESTVPPVTCPAWPCMFTGRNPGKIGMYGFFSVDLGQEYRIKISSSSDYHQWSLWKRLNDYGIPVGLLNVAMTFPPHNINSFMVCGIGSPASGRADYTYPTWLKRELNRVAPGYEPLPPADITIHGKEREYQEILEQEVSNRVKVARYLMNAFPWQLFVGVFFAVDSAQHYFWHHTDDTHPRHKGEEYRDVIKGVYKKVDAAIGELMEELPAETNVLIVSDHGFQTCHRDFVVNRWLQKQGLLTLLSPVGDKPDLSLLWRIRDSLLSVLSPKAVRTIARALPEWLIMKLSSRGKAGYNVANFYRNVDWGETQAYFQGGAGGIRINLKGREPQGIVEPGSEYEKLVDDIVDRLKKTADPETGERVSITVLKRDEIYRGDYASMGPDVALYFEKYMPVGGGRRGQSEWGEPAWPGWHARNGVFMAYGPDMKDSGGKLENLRIYDITPTVLHMFGLPIPDDMDGRVLTEIFELDSEPAKRPVTCEPTGEKQKVKDEISKIRSSGKI